MTRTPEQIEAENATLRKKVKALELLVFGLRGLNACYRIGTQRGADKALDAIHKGDELLALLNAPEPVSGSTDVSAGDA